MRKYAAIFMLIVFAFNIAGYQLLYNYMANKFDKALELALDENNYNENELLTIKQPTNLPYYTNSKTYQRIDGEVEMNGTKYKYVKCRIYNDSLEMLCIPNKGKMQVEQSKREYAQCINDFQQNDSQKKANGSGKSFQKLLSEYEELSILDINTSYQIVKTNFLNSNSISFLSNYFTTIKQPPEVA